MPEGNNRSSFKNEDSEKYMQAFESLNNELFFQQALDSLNSNIAVLDQNGFICYVNPNWIKFGKANGLRSDYCFEGIDFLELCRNSKGEFAEGSRITADAIEQLIDGQRESFELEYHYKANDDVRWFALQARRFEYMEQAWVVLAHIEITETKKVQQEKANLAAELELAKRDLNDFTYIVSSDFKAPIRGIQTLIKWILTDNLEQLNEDGKGQLKLLEERAKKLGQLINGIVEYSRISGQSQDCVQVDLNQLLKRIINAAVTAPEIVIVPNNLPQVYADPMKIMLLFTHLIGNAVKFNDSPVPRVEIKYYDDHEYHKFVVSDNGCGIKEKNLERIFEIFQTCRSSKEKQGCGVGLALAKKIVESYGGGIWAESEIEKGSKISFTLRKKQGS